MDFMDNGEYDDDDNGEDEYDKHFQVNHGDQENYGDDDDDFDEDGVDLMITLTLNECTM